MTVPTTAQPTIRHCLLCDKPIDFTQPYFSTFGVFLPPDDPLYRFCGMPLHWDCVAAWDQHRDFIDAYFRGWVHEMEHRQDWYLLDLNNDYLLRTKPNPPEMAVEIILHETGSRIQVPVADWTNWLKNPHISGRHEWEQTALMRVLPELRRTYKNEAKIYQKINWW